LVELCAGQHRDLAVADGAEPTLAEYLAMIGGKTAALLQASAELGALAAGASPAVRAAYARFGRELGLAFQLQDDLLDVWGTAAQMGKPAREDLRARKHSLPIVLACHRAPAGTRAELRRLYAEPAPLPDATVEALVAEMEALGVHTKAERMVREHHEAALAALAVAAPREPGSALLRALADSLLGRQS
jgi:geranylgeranyl diphosphate synthase type I